MRIKYKPSNEDIDAKNYSNPKFYFSWKIILLLYFFYWVNVDEINLGSFGSILLFYSKYFRSHLLKRIFIAYFC